jgi:hypothetical protein
VPSASRQGRPAHSKARVKAARSLQRTFFLKRSSGTAPREAAARPRSECNRVAACDTRDWRAGWRRNAISTCRTPRACGSPVRYQDALPPLRSLGAAGFDPCCVGKRPAVRCLVGLPHYISATQPSEATSTLLACCSTNVLQHGPNQPRTAASISSLHQPWQQAPTAT